MDIFDTGQLWLPFLVGGGGAFLGSVMLVLTMHWHGHLSADSVVGVQKFHTHPTPRIGGVAIACGFALGWAVAPKGFFGGLLWPLLLAGIPAFAFGLLEDITKRVSVRIRLFATMACGVLGYALTGLAIRDVNVPGLDWLLGFAVISVAFTALAVGGVANAINIIDGFNGLSAGTVVIISAGFTLICLQAGDVHLMQVCLLMGATVLGFMLVNWPLGKIFLGDGGAYFVGFGLAWIAVLMLDRHPEISAWAPMLVCGYPLLEVAFSVMRRHRRGLGVGAADRLHLHSLVKRRVVKRLFPKASNLARNSTTGAAMWLAALLPALIATRWATDTPMLAAGFAVCAFAYSAVYARLTQFVWCFAAATKRPAAILEGRS
jgi:UDP-N-acetylmuramyl pentapeptide phosphotransferase/UDP-N-acetylglucosamine-1-phosphate transferase